MEGWERYTHIFIYTFTYTPRSFMLGYNSPESVLYFYEATLPINIPSHQTHLEE